MDVHKMLEQVKAGQLDIAEAEAKLKDLPYEDLGYAKLDHHRKLRAPRSRQRNINWRRGTYRIPPLASGR